MKQLITTIRNFISNWAEQDTAPDYLIIAIKTTGSAIVGMGLLRIFYEMGANPESFDAVGGVIASSFLILRQEVSYRGGGVEISLEDKGHAGEKMTAYQNYLGGGMLGRIENSCTIDNWRDDSELRTIAEDLSRYFHSLTVHDDEWEWETYEQNQNKPLSAF
ncbi:MAG: hypothetical protein L7V85_08360 [Bacteroidia bacterium]|nr:hypothetical protein [Bacteroidia bacterium]